MVEYNVGSYSERRSINSDLLGFFGWAILVILALAVGSNMISGDLMIQFPYFGATISSILGFVLIIVTFLGLLFNIFGRS